MPRIAKWTILSVAWLAAACVADGGDQSSPADAEPEARRSRDLTLAAPQDDGATAVSQLELGRTERIQASTASEDDLDGGGSPDREVVRETYAYTLEPALAALPEVMRALSDGGSPSAAYATAPVGAAALARGRTVGIPSPKPIEFTRPSTVSDREPYEFASLASVFAPSEGGLLGIVRGGSCGPRGGL